MSHSQYWKWKTAIADASRFAAWSRDIAYLQMYMATPGKLLPWEIPIALREIPIALRRLESGRFEFVRELSQNEPTPAGLWRGERLSPEPQPFSPLIIRGLQGRDEPIFTSTEVVFNGDHDTNDSSEDFQVTFHHLKGPHEGGCRTNGCSYDILVRCAIVRLAHYFPAVRVFSDGGESALKIPVNICRYVFEDETAYPLWQFDDDGEEV